MTSDTPNHYATLGVPSSATADEIRRAYRILARRYHPDVNPGKKSEEKFKAIAAAYSVLSDTEAKQKYDSELANRSSEESTYRRTTSGSTRTSARARYYEHMEKVKEYLRTSQSAEAAGSAQPSHRTNENKTSTSSGISSQFGKLFNPIGSLFKGQTSDSGPANQRSGTRLSLLEVSVNMREAVLGSKKTVELNDGDVTRKISVNIPPGARSGTIIRLRDRKGTGEELVIILRVATHPTISIENRGLIVEVPVTLGEAVLGAKITLPTLDEPVLVSLPACTQSGTELRIKGKGIFLKDGSRGDLFYRVLIKIPETPELSGLKERASDFEKYYQGHIRSRFPKILLNDI